MRNREDFDNKVDKMLTVLSSSNRSKQPRTVGSSRSSMMYSLSALSNSGSEIEPEPSLSKNWKGAAQRGCQLAASSRETAETVETVLEGTPGVLFPPVPSCFAFSRKTGAKQAQNSCEKASRFWGHLEGPPQPVRAGGEPRLDLLADQLARTLHADPCQAALFSDA